MPRGRVDRLVLLSLAVLTVGFGGWHLLTADHPTAYSVTSVPVPPVSPGRSCISPTVLAGEKAEGQRVTWVGPAWLDQDPTGATLVWAVTDRANGMSCATSVTHVDAVAARRLAHDVDVAQQVPEGPASCPNDDGSWLGIYTQTERGTQLVVVELSGCGYVDAPDRLSRWRADQLFADLVQLAPDFAAARLTG